MDFQSLLDHADYNTAESNYKPAIATKYSSVLPPPKKVPKSNVQSDNIKRFLEKKKREEEARAAEARRKKEELLAKRAQNSKSSKKAKIMASRTKDNDFSKIKLTDDEIEAKKKREAELIRKNLTDKVERMKARIEMEEKEKLLPKKRKRKSKNGELIEKFDDHPEDLNNYQENLNSSMKNCDKNSHRGNSIKKPSRPPPPSNLSFTELLKIAEKKRFEPMDIVVEKKEEQKLMTKKERKFMEEELARQRRKEERMREKLMAENGHVPKPSRSSQIPTSNKKKCLEKSEGKKPYVIHVEKDSSKPIQDASKFKIPKGTINASINKSVPSKLKDTGMSKLNTGMSKSNHPNLPSVDKSVKSSVLNGVKKVKPNVETNSLSKETEVRKKVSVPKKNGLKVSPVQMTPTKQTATQPKFDEEAFKASLEKKIREKIEREIEEKLAAKIAQIQSLQPPKVETPKPVKKEPVNNVKKVSEKPVVRTAKDIERMEAIKKQILEQRSKPKPKIPEKKPFNKNPYLDPPRRLLEPQRPPRPPAKRRIESDDDEDDDDDMSDFIDDGPSQNEEDYSRYIKEIFGYDRNRYVDDDDDDIRETSFAEQMKEEVRSARLGYLEDLEEERLELERQKKKKKNK